ncbi:MAG TPA: hypothetical protein VES88_14730 [Gemmatimonadaceae bacterium]|nr:hypothetical protein [Gemmatimonadaceae bacterium]
MTDLGPRAASDCGPQLRTIARRSVHESRNALNGLVVNVEVVRSRLARSGNNEDVLAFAESAAAQGEASVRMTEGVGALLSLIVGAIDAGGRLRCSAVSTSPETLRFELEPGIAERVLPSLTVLGMAVGFSAETSDAETVILSFPEPSSAANKKHE